MTIHAVPGQSPDAIFQSHLAENELWLQVCDDCNRQVFFPRVFCPHCGGGLTWAKTAGIGAVYSTTTVRQRPDRGGDYNISLIDLDEGARMMSRIEGITPEAVQIGLKVRAVIAERDGGRVVVFEPAEGHAS